MNDIFQVDYLPNEKKIKINLPEEVWRNINTVIMTRLFQEELVVEKQKEGEGESSKSCADCKLSDCYSNQELIDEIEALQKENNGWQERYYELDAGHSRLFKDFCKLQKENEQLRAQVARMRKSNEN